MRARTTEGSLGVGIFPGETLPAGRFENCIEHTPLPSLVAKQARTSEGACLLTRVHGNELGLSRTTHYPARDGR